MATQENKTGANTRQLNDQATALAEEKLAEAMHSDGKRPNTIKGYVETLAKLRDLFPLGKARRT